MSATPTNGRVTPFDFLKAAELDPARIDDTELERTATVGDLGLLATGLLTIVSVQSTVIQALMEGDDAHARRLMDASARVFEDTGALVRQLIYKRAR